MTKKELIDRAYGIFGDVYSYEMVPDNFKSSDTISIVCKEHGVFTKSVTKHLCSKQGCQKCSGRFRYDTTTFIEKLNTLDSCKNYTFEKVNYINNKTNVIVTCKEHGDFLISPGHLLSGEGCPKCRYIKSANSNRRSVDEVIAAAKSIHGDKYDYSLITDYKNDRIKYKIICPEHGVFEQTMNNHIKGKQGCPICGRIKSDKERTISFDEFKDRANIIHNNKYTYIEDTYHSMEDKLSIICPEHGVFEQKASNHVNLGQGCPVCGNSESKTENELYEFICSIIGESNVKRRCRSVLDNGLELDIYVPSKNIAFEFNGLYWHSELSKDSNYHLNKTIQCNNKGINLFHIYEDEWIYKKDIIKSMIKNQFSVSDRRIFARKCKIKEVDFKTAKNFLNTNHLQGHCPSNTNYGLYYNDELVSIMTFGKSRHFVGSNDNSIELLRFCNKINTSVVGGASKLFNHYIKNNQFDRIVSYADRRWSSGNLYDKLNFVKYNESKPNYFYIIKHKRVYRFNLRKSVLVSKYGCPTDMSEREFCKQQKWFRIYDCGCMCYEYKKY